MTSLNRSMCVSALTGLCLAAVSPVMGQNFGTADFSNIGITALNPSGTQVGTINSAVILPHVFNDAPGSVLTPNNSYPGSITLSEANVANGTGNGLERDVWYFSNDGGTSPYQFQSGDYFSATFDLTLTGGIVGKDLEGGFLFSNPSGAFGGDCQIFVVGQGGNAGVVFQGGGPSYYPFSPLAGGYPGVGGAVPNYPLGSTYTLGFTYTIDPGTGKDAFEYSVNGQMAANATTGNYFDLNGPVGSAGDYLGGYFQLAPAQVPEPSTLALLGLGLLPLTRLFRRRS